MTGGDSLRRKARLMRRTPMRRAQMVDGSRPRPQLRPRSAKMTRVYQQTRRGLVAAILDAFPVCQLCKVERSRDVHELLSRARGGSITDPWNCTAVCRGCHDFIGAQPIWAERHGWALPSGTRAIVRPLGVPALGEAA